MVNLSFSFRTPSTSSLAPEGHRVETASGRYGNKNEFAMKRRQKTTNRGNENSPVTAIYSFSFHNHIKQFITHFGLSLWNTNKKTKESIERDQEGRVS